MKLLPAILASVLALQEPIAAPVEPPEWIHLVPFGSWKGHPMRAFTVGEAEARQVVANFEARGGAKLVVDYEHQTLNTVKNGAPAPASAWVDRLELRTDGVWGHVEGWTPKAQEYLRSREYRYLSPVLMFGHKNKRSGLPEGLYLHSVALTNTPFLDELVPVVNSDGTTPEMKMDELKTLLGLAPDATEAQVMAALTELVALRDEVVLVLSEPGKLPTIAELRTLLAEAAVPLALGEKALASLAPAEGEDLVALSARLDKVLNHSGYVPIAEHVAALTEGAAQVVALTDEQLFSQAKAAGKLTPPLEDWFKRQLARDRDGAVLWLSEAPVVVPLRASPRGPTAPAKSLTPTELAVVQQLGLTEAQFLAHRES